MTTDITDIYSQLSQEQLTHLKDAFSAIDNDNDSLITEKDLIHTFKQLNKPINNEEINKMLSYSNDKEITFATFLSLMSSQLGELSSREELMKAFSVFDITSEDNTDVLNSKAKGHKKTLSSISNMISTYDNLDEEAGFKGNEKRKELKLDVEDLKENLRIVGMKEKDIDSALKGFIKVEMDGTEIFLAERFVNTIRDD
ncbi:EF-hand [Ascoidea rubescens DSM 1968]|uniref:EF-hand n=1 Tax=Ascoidea rubescens DSM 1968 TaxID=1344418 RepID=A0A1D2VJE7_9ASCO|nr:EF-hand [Ascoidea rubescens DSM 1968]ODV61749.1 EF-hand [Ascoidea rubescens DSM 1968]